MVKEFSFSDGEVIRGMVLQGERHTYREPTFPEENKVLFTIPVRRKIVGDAIGDLLEVRAFRDDNHNVSIVQLNKDNLAEIAEGDYPEATKELAAAIEMATNGNWIKDGDYFALYWCDAWADTEESSDDDEEEEAEEEEVDREIDLAELGQQRAAEREGYDDRR